MTKLKTSDRTFLLRAETYKNFFCLVTCLRICKHISHMVPDSHGLLVSILEKNLHTFVCQRIYFVRLSLVWKN